MTYYDVLGVAPTATGEEMRRAYQERAKLIHPDYRFGEPDHVIAMANQEMAALNEAWDTLRDGDRRAEYDRILRLDGPLTTGGRPSRSNGHAPENDRSNATKYKHEADPRFPRRMRLPNECVVCGSAPARAARFRISDVAMFVGRTPPSWGRPYPMAGTFCRKCAQSVFRDATNKTLCVGWVRPVPVVLNVFVIVSNLVNIARFSEMALPVRYPGVLSLTSTPLSKGHTLLARAGIYWSCFLALGYWEVWNLLGVMGVFLVTLILIAVGQAASQIDRVWSDTAWVPMQGSGDIPRAARGNVRSRRGAGR